MIESSRRAQLQEQESTHEDSVQISMRELREMELARQQKDKAREAWRRREAERRREEAERRQELASEHAAAEQRRLELDQAECARLRAEREHLEAVASQRAAEARLVELQLALNESHPGSEPVTDLRQRRRWPGLVVAVAAVAVLQLVLVSNGDAGEERFHELESELSLIEARLDTACADAPVAPVLRADPPPSVEPSPAPPAPTTPTSTRPRPRPRPKPVSDPRAGRVVLDCDVNSPLCE